MSSDFEQIASEVIHEGFLTTLYERKFRHADGEVVSREVTVTPGAVAIVAHDDEHVWLVRQPREALGVPDLLELPAGRRDVDGEPPLETAKRELAEEIGKAAEAWELLRVVVMAPGFSDDEIHLYLATGLSHEQRDSGENERIEIIAHPLADLDALIADTRDAKTLIGLYELQRRRAV